MVHRYRVPEEQKMESNDDQNETAEDRRANRAGAARVQLAMEALDVDSAAEKLVSDAERGGGVVILPPSTGLHPVTAEAVERLRDEGRATVSALAPFVDRATGRTVPDHRLLLRLT